MSQQGSAGNRGGGGSSKPMRANHWEPEVGLKERERGERRFQKGKRRDTHSVLCIRLVLSVCWLDVWAAGKAILNPVEAVDPNFL